MKEILTQKQLNSLSAYLDDRLTPLEKQKVEELLQRNSAFKNAFEDMQYSRRLLRSLPRRRAPRNFTLSAAMANVPVRRNWAAPAMSFVSMAAVLALVVVFVSSTVLPNLGAAKSAPVAESAALQAEAPMAVTDASRAAATSEATPQIFLWNSGFAGGMGGGGDGNAPSTGAYGIGGGPGGAEGSGLPTVVATAEPTFTAEQLSQANPDNLILGLPSADTMGKMIEPAAETAAVEQPLRQPPLGTTAWLEISFGTVAVLSGVAALILRRRR